MEDEYGFEMGHPEHTTPKKDRIRELLVKNPNACYADVAFQVFASAQQVSAIGRKMGLGKRRGRGINIPGTKFKDLSDYGHRAARIKGGASEIPPPPQ